MAFPGKVAEHIPEPLRPGLIPVVEQIDDLNARIQDFDEQIERLCEERYPETELLRQVEGVGPKCALYYVLTIEDPTRFRQSRSVGPYLGLVPRQDDSGETERRGRITKKGNTLCRRLLVQSAHYILGPFGTDSDLRRWGKRLEEGSGQGGRKRGPPWRWPGSWPSCCTGSGSLATNTTRCIRPDRTKPKPPDGGPHSTGEEHGFPSTPRPGDCERPLSP